MGRKGRIIFLCACLAGFVGWFLYAWSVSFTNKNSIVIYFGRPTDLWSYASSNGGELLRASVLCFATASGSLILAGVTAVLLLVLGLFSDERLRLIERVGAGSQTIPVLVIVTVFLLIEQGIFEALNLRPSADWYCIVPVTLALVFPPLVNGAGAIARMPIQLKALFRVWDAPAFWRIWRVYLPYAIPDVLTGIRASSTWAVGATLIAEGLVNGVGGDSRTLGHALIIPFQMPPGKTPVVILIATVLGYAVYVLFAEVQRRIENRLQGEAVVGEKGYRIQSERSTPPNRVEEKTHGS
jgi:NitT/TauT family transport system permease protein